MSYVQPFHATPAQPFGSPRGPLSPMAPPPSHPAAVRLAEIERASIDVGERAARLGAGGQRHVRPICSPRRSGGRDPGPVARAPPVHACPVPPQLRGSDLATSAGHYQRYLEGLLNGPPPQPAQQQPPPVLPPPAQPMREVQPVLRPQRPPQAHPVELQPAPAQRPPAELQPSPVQRRVQVSADLPQQPQQKLTAELELLRQQLSSAQAQLDEYRRKEKEVHEREVAAGRKAREAQKREDEAAAREEVARAVEEGSRMRDVRTRKRETELAERERESASPPASPRGRRGRKSPSPSPSPQAASSRQLLPSVRRDGAEQHSDFERFAETVLAEPSQGHTMHHEQFARFAEPLCGGSQAPHATRVPAHGDFTAAMAAELGCDLEQLSASVPVV